MKNSLRYILFSVILLYLISCKENQSVDLLKQAQIQITENPTNALNLLDSIKSPESMGKDYYMQYIVALVQARYLSDQDITGDTLIFDAQRFFNNQNNPDKAAIANYYAGTVYLAKQVPDKALKSFLFSEDYALKNNDFLLVAKSLHFLGNLYYEQNMLDSAIIHYKDALNFYNNESESTVNRLMAMSNIGRAFEIKDDLDSAHYYFSKAMKIANITNNKQYQVYNK